jgi:hypothetical protein
VEGAYGFAMPAQKMSDDVVKFRHDLKPTGGRKAAHSESLLAVHGEFLNTTGIKHLRGPGTIAGNERLSCSGGPFHRVHGEF